MLIFFIFFWFWKKTKHKLDLHHPAIQRALGAGFGGNVLDGGRESSSPTLQSQGEQNGLLSEVEKQRKGEDSMDSEISTEVRSNGDLSWYKRKSYVYVIFLQQVGFENLYLNTRGWSACH